jgi:putative glycosyltransferase (TIGR04372 family)
MSIKLYPTRISALVGWCFTELLSSKQRVPKLRRMVADIGLLATGRRVWEAIVFRLGSSRYLTARGQYSEAIARIEQKLSVRPLDLDLYFALGAAHHARGSLPAAVDAWTKGMKAQAELASGAGVSMSTRYLGTMFTRMIGHTTYLDIIAKRKLLGLAPVQKYIVLADHTNIGNAAYVECWRDYFEIISDPETIRRHAPIARLVEDYPTVLSIDDKWYFVQDAAIEIEARWHDAGKAPLLSLKDGQRDRARRELETLGLPPDCWFVTLHVREGGGASRRDGNIGDYIPAIRRITQAGGWVVRIGDASMTKLPDIPNLIDCAHAPRRDWLDVYALGAARFVIGTNSGPVFVAGTFGVPALLTNWAPIGIKSQYRNTITLPQRLWSRADNRFLTPDEEKSGPFAFSEWTHLLEQHNVSQVRNSPEQIIAGVDEMMSRY